MIYLLGQYLKAHLKVLVLFILFALVFMVVFSLYQLPLEAVVYAITLCAVIGLLLTLLGFRGFYQKHRLLQEIQNRITISIEDLPPAKTLLAKDYTELLQLLYQNKCQVESNAAIRYSEMVDYYTMWAHQIKTPIAAMQLLLQAEENETNAELLEQLFRIEQYVGMVLQYLRLENMSADLVIKTYSLDAIIKSALRKYAKTFIRKKISLDYQDLNQQVLTDEKWLLFVIEQLLSNALKYTSNGGKIKIYLADDAPKTLVIQDTGIGIAAEDIPRVFEKGFTGYNGRTDKKSTGIGLYLCQQILQNLSHTINIRSTVGQGTTIEIDLNMVDFKFE